MPVLEGTVDELKQALDRVAAGAPVDKEPRYWLAPQAEEVARRLIPQHHKHLANARIAYIFAKSLPARNGKVPMANARKVPEAQRLLHGYDFVITINEDAWMLLTQAQREALIDHELSHCGMKQDGSWTIWAHDVEEFAAVIKRHGLWHDGARVFAKAVEQLEFDLEGAAQ